jgi:hypothetical protein
MALLYRRTGASAHHIHMIGNRPEAGYSKFFKTTNVSALMAF